MVTSRAPLGARDSPRGLTGNSSLSRVARGLATGSSTFRGMANRHTTALCAARGRPLSGLLAWGGCAMRMVSESEAERLLTLARAGDGAALGRLLEAYRSYLALLARLQVGRRLQGKLESGDLVQETFLAAHCNFAQFRGNHEGEFVSWLRQILASRLAKLIRHYCGTQRRNIRLERQLGVDLEESS